MLGIIFTGGECPPAGIIRQALEGEKPLVIAADSGLAAAEEAGLDPHWITGDMDSLDDISRLAAYPPERVMRHGHEKDFTDTELAFSLALEKGCGDIWIIGGGGGRIDHLFAIRSLFEGEDSPARWYTAREEIRTVEEGIPLQMSLAAGSMVSVFPLGEKPWAAESEGLKWPLNGLSWEKGRGGLTASKSGLTTPKSGLGISNVATDGSFLIRSVRGRFMVISQISGSVYGSDCN